MTTYILTGGRDRAHPDYGSKLTVELKKHHEKFRVLSCFFAEPEEYASMLAEKWQPWFEKRVGSIEKYDYARMDSFLRQIKDFDILYLHGGPNRPLFDALDTFGDFAPLVAGKIVVGSSAGANFIAKNYWGSSKQKPGKGRAILDVNVMVHYGSPDHEGRPRTAGDWDYEEALFRDFIGTNEKIWHLPEGEVEVFEAKD
ncbi:MAG TPA: hypothetical protein VK694_00555 [Verrucomicrobiae bacterium]|nr:hypothetical protein [Verrucomicrobiae bacterium]